MNGDRARWQEMFARIPKADPLLLGLAPDGLPWDAPVDDQGRRYSRWSDVRNPLPGETAHVCRPEFDGRERRPA